MLSARELGARESCLLPFMFYHLFLSLKLIANNAKSLWDDFRLKAGLHAVRPG